MKLRRSGKAGVALTGAVTLTLAMCSATLPADATPHAASSALMTGNVIDSNGKPAAGAVVTVTAWPTGAVQDATVPVEGTFAGPTAPIDPDDTTTKPTETYNLADTNVKAPTNPASSITTAPVATTTTNATGRFTITANLASLSSDYKDSAGEVNLQVDTVDSTNNMQTADVPAAVTGSVAAADTDSPSASTGAQMATVNFNLSKATVSTQIGSNTAVATADPTAAQAANVASASAPAASDSPNTAAAPVPVVCGSWYDDAFYPSRYEHYADFYNNSAGSQDGYTLEETLSAHETGIGVAVTGGSWSASGTETLHVSEGVGQDAHFQSNHHMWNLVNTHHWMRKCHGPYHTWYDHQVKMSSFHDLMSSPTGTVIYNRQWGSCSYKTGHTWKTVGAGHDFTIGLQAPFINLSSQASYSTHQRMDWWPDHAFICGDYNTGWASSHVVGIET